MGTATHTERLDIRLDSNTKRLAEWASAVAGYATLADFLTYLIRENAPRVIREPSVRENAPKTIEDMPAIEELPTIKLTNEEFDRFVDVCMNDTSPPSPRILEAARRLDEEGF